MAVAGVESAAGVVVFVIFAALFGKMAGGGLYEKIRSMKKIFTLSLSVLLVLLTAVWQTLSAQTVLFHEGFDNGVLPTGWTVIDADGDGYGWEGSANPASYFQAGTALSGSGHNGSNGFVLSGSYSNVTNTAINPNNWLISPVVNLSSNATLTFWVCAQDANYAAEHYGVYISTNGGTAAADFTLLYEETIDANGGAKAQGLWKQKTVDLSEYTGQTVRIAFLHFNCSDMFILNLDDVEITTAQTVPVTHVYVTPGGAGSRTGYSWENAMSSIAGAQFVAEEMGLDVWVAAGTYYGDTTASNAFTMHNGVNVYGGFSGDEPADYDLSMRDFVANETILDGDSARRVLYQPSVFNIETMWDGFTIRNGVVSGNGAGVYLL